MCKTSPEKVAPPEIVTDRRSRPNLGCSRGDNNPKFFITPRRVPSSIARHTAKNGRQCHSIQIPFTYGLRRPVIVLPASVDWSREPAALRYCLAHEWSHVCRYDVACLW